MSRQTSFGFGTTRAREKSPPLILQRFPRRRTTKNAQKSTWQTYCTRKSGYFKIDADMSDEDKEELVRIAQKYSPVFNSVSKPVQVTVELDRS